LYIISPPDEGLWEIKGLEMIVTFPSASTLADATMPNLSGENFFGLTLTNGIRLFAVSENRLAINSVFLTLRDFMLIGYEIINTMSNGTNTTVSVKLEFPQGVSIFSRRDDRLAFELKDNFSTFSYFRMKAIGRQLLDTRAL